MLFNTISGHRLLKKNILNLQQRKGSTILFTGPAGSASLALALAYATYLHCKKPEDTDACGACTSCRKMSKFLHPDLHFTFPIGSTQHIKGKDVQTINFLSQWRDYLRQNPYGTLQTWSAFLQNEVKNLQIGKPQAHTIKQIVNLKPFESKYTILLIWLPELLHHAASNALLKTLEEPSSHTIFILISIDPTQLLPTIYSRSLEIYVPVLNSQTIDSSKKLQKHGGVTKDSYAVESFYDVHFEQFTSWLRFVYIKHWTKIIQSVENFYTLPVQLQKNWIIYGLHIIRGALLLKFSQKHMRGLNEKERIFCQKLSSTMHQSYLETIVQTLEKTHDALVRNAHAKLLLLSTSLHLAEVIQVN